MTLTKKVISVMGEYQEVQTKDKDKDKDTVARQFKIVKPDATAEEVQEVLDGGGNSVFTDQVLSTGHAADIQDKHKDITKLKTSITELHRVRADCSCSCSSCSSCCCCSSSCSSCSCCCCC